jgi:hypothetical protein
MLAHTCAVFLLVRSSRSSEVEALNAWKASNTIRHSIESQWNMAHSDSENAASFAAPRRSAPRVPRALIAWQ